MQKYFEIFIQFLFLGCISFGGPVAHLGYFHHQFVDKLKWLNQESYARIIALSQFLPGPGSSQAGFAIGYQRAGIGGGCAAFLGFTLPSFFLMYGFAKAHYVFKSNLFFNNLLQGLKLLTAVVVADACLKMFLKFCQHWPTRILCLLSTLTLVMFSGVFVQILVLCAAALLGCGLTHHFQAQHSLPVTQKSAHSKQTRENVALILFIGLLVLCFIIAASESSAKQYTNTLLFAEFYQAGSLVFGGGHVVLPLLQEFFGGSISDHQFLSGYAGAQAVPGPMFSFASFLGALLNPDRALTGALIACLGIFLPGFLLIIALYHRWEFLAQRPRVAAAVTALNAAVVGLLFSALFQPIFSSSIKSISDLVIVASAWAALYFFKLHIIVLVIAFSLGFGALRTFF